MRAGRLRHLVQIQSAVDTRTSTGRPTRTWSTEDEVWASIKPLSGAESVDALGKEGQVGYDIRIRYRDDVKPKQRIVHDGRYMEIVSVHNMWERGRELSIMAREVTD